MAILKSEMPDSSDRLDRIESAIEELVAADRRLQVTAGSSGAECRTGDSVHTDNERRIAQLMDTMNRLANIVISHEQRLDDLDNR